MSPRRPAARAAIVLGLLALSLVAAALPVSSPIVISARSTSPTERVSIV